MLPRHEPWWALKDLKDTPNPVLVKEENEDIRASFCTAKKPQVNEK